MDSGLSIFILPTTGAGGTENYALRFIQFNQDEKKFLVISISKKRGDLHEKFLQAGVELKYQDIGYFNLWKCWLLYLLFRKSKPDSVIAFNGNFGGIPILIARLAGIKKRVVFYRRSTPAFRMNHWKLQYFRIMGWLVDTFATDILSNSLTAFKNFFPNYQSSDKRFKVIYNGVDSKLVTTHKSKNECRKNLGIPKEVFVIGHVGRFDPAKNHEFIFRVANKLLKLESDIYFVFCGMDTNSERFMHNISEFDIQKNCISLGLRDNIAQVYKCFDVFLFPSITEGQPNALIEAMLAGVPILASNIDPIKESVPDFFSSKLFSLSDENFVVKQLLSLKQNPELLDKFILQDFAKQQYDPAIRFSEFKNTLLKL